MLRANFVGFCQAFLQLQAAVARLRHGELRFLWRPACWAVVCCRSCLLHAAVCLLVSLVAAGFLMYEPAARGLIELGNWKHPACSALCFQN